MVEVVKKVNRNEYSEGVTIKLDFSKECQWMSITSNQVREAAAQWTDQPKQRFWP
jgi:hypothetical protein